MTRTKNRIHAVLHANLIPPYQGKLFMAPGRKWLEEQPLAEDERVAVVGWLAALDSMEQELAEAEQALAAACLGDDRIRRLMTIGGINMSVAAGVVSAVGDVSRFASAERVVSYLGLDPRVRSAAASSSTNAAPMCSIGCNTRARSSPPGGAVATALQAEPARSGRDVPDPRVHLQL
jgi:transposase